MQIDLFKDAVVWTRDNCPACESVKKLLNQHGYVVAVKDISDNIAEFKKTIPGAKTVPQVIINGRYIGGLLQVKEYLTRK